MLIAAPAENPAIYAESTGVGCATCYLGELHVRTLGLTMLIATPTFHLTTNSYSTAVGFPRSKAIEAALGRIRLAMIIRPPT